MANVALLLIVLSLRVLVAFVPPRPWLGRTVDSSRRSVSTSKAPPVDSSSEEVDITGGDKVGQLGRPHTESSRAKISAANKGKVPWNVGKSHSEETRLLIAEKTREAMVRRKSLKLQELGLTQEDYDLQRLQQKKEKKRSTVKGGLTEEGRRRISESVKERWKDPEYRAKYTVANKGARNHSEATRARISEAITLKWQQPEYREKVKSKPSEEVRARISHTLKNKWQQQDFRDRMLAQQFPRTEEWKNKLSESIKNKWQDPEYRASVTSGIRSSNKTLVRRPFDPSRPPRPRRPSSSSTRLPRAPRMTAEERRARRKQERQERQEKERVRKAAFKLAKEDQKKSGGASRLKELLGRELWFEEKMKRREKGDRLLDDESLERQLVAEFNSGMYDEEDEEEDTDSFGDDDEDEDEDDDDDEDSTIYEDELYDGPTYADVLDAKTRAPVSQFSSDIIEVYDEDGNLIGSYTDAEFEALKKSKAK